jgi:hypothetical protein
MTNPMRLSLSGATARSTAGSIAGSTALATARRSKAVILLAVCVLGLALGGCDKCGDFLWNKPGACHSYGPPEH